MHVICDLCGHLPEFPPGSEWSNGAKVIGGCLVFVVLCGRVFGVVECKNEKANRTGWTKHGMIEITGALTGSILSCSP